MQLDVKVMRHPTRQQLVAYAETLVDRRSPVSVALAGHVSCCAQCSAEMRRIRESLEFTRSASPLEPSNNLTAQILLEAKKARQDEEQLRRRRSPWWTAVQAAGFAGGVAAVAVLVFSAALEVTPATALAATSSATAAAPEFSPSALEKVGNQIKALSSAVHVGTASATSPLDRERLRTVSAIGADISAAKAALERNPGCVRATHIVNANMERSVRTLRDLYIEQTF